MLYVKRRLRGSLPLQSDVDIVAQGNKATSYIPLRCSAILPLKTATMQYTLIYFIPVCRSLRLNFPAFFDRCSVQPAGAGALS